MYTENPFSSYCEGGCSYYSSLNFDDLDDFIKFCKKLGFDFDKKDESNLVKFANIF